MREGKKHGRTDDRDDDRAFWPILEDALNETSINQLLAERDRRDQGEKGKAFHVVLRKKLQRELRDNALRFGGLRNQATQTHHLIEQNQGREQDRDARCERRTRQGQTELTRANLVGAGAPQDDARRAPLK